ncbi:type III pantothenate kinase [[Mycoplasma] mobile]|uniref:Type III pantothenate kinase n=1 Tax=Mycoplasma mobile (strain ATCC 43663 / 163K / NCTC 11711) TaxID=267748 RepID=COAX_MYCM1|nr:type III pantothenate kinase [[Mycoplasma] mobile]Q6KH54.1 RecName: Full=Type III pantothenate kinase; AltName: Full=PanK-III; AltName: Full=Pantothenic acid kinase [Mycoplasma mobile 163K]AAT28077.1 putative transcriptional regulator [Mycoplasma mobile 163K]
MNLYLDIGNTNLKFGYEIENQFHFYTLPTLENYTCDMLSKNLESFIKKQKFNYLIVSSVVPSLNLVIKDFASIHLKSKVMFIDKIKKEILNLNGREHSSIGSDIIANALYVSSRYEDAIVISLGTATVIFHVVSKRLEGAIIAPGVKNSYLSLIQSAKKLSEVILKLPRKNLGGNTQEAISLGILKGNFHLINGFINELDPKGKSKILITGGNYGMLKDVLKDYEYVDNMVILGLKDYYEIFK